MKIALLLILTLSAYACVQSEPDPEAYLDDLRDGVIEGMEGMGYMSYSDDELLALGFEACTLIDEAHARRPEAKRGQIIFGVSNLGFDRSMGKVAYTNIVFAASAYLCPEGG